jgi:hypothetical protein
MGKQKMADMAAEAFPVAAGSLLQRQPTTMKISLTPRKFSAGRCWTCVVSP